MLSAKARAIMEEEPQVAEEILKECADMALEQLKGLQIVTEMHSELAGLLSERTKKLFELPVTHEVDGTTCMPKSGMDTALENRIAHNVEILCGMSVALLEQTSKAHGLEGGKNA